MNFKMSCSVKHVINGLTCMSITFPAVIHESTNFIDSLLPDRPTGVIRRKKKTGATVAITSVPGAVNKTGPPTPTTAKPPTPTSPHVPISPTTAIKNTLPIVPSVSIYLPIWFNSMQNNHDLLCNEKYTF